MGLQCDPPAFISTEEGVSPTTIIITSRIFTGFSHGYKRQRFSYDTGRCYNQDGGDTGLCSSTPWAATYIMSMLKTVNMLELPPLERGAPGSAYDVQTPKYPSLACTVNWACLQFQLAAVSAVISQELMSSSATKEKSTWGMIDC